MTPATATAPATGLSAAQLAEYHAQGYLLVRGLFDAKRMAALGDEVDGLHERMAGATPASVSISWEELPADRPQRIRQLMNSEQVSPILDAMSRSAEILDIMTQLIGPDVYLFHSKLMMKAALDGTFTPWHQDWGYWQHHSRQPTQVNGMLAIDAADADNGAIRFVPATHLRGPVTHQDFASSSFSLGLVGDLDAFPNQLVAMEPGDGVFFGPLVIHGSGPNRSPRDRRANTFAFDGRGNQKNGELAPEMHRRGAR